MKDFGYDVSNYRQVDPLFGTIEDFDAIVRRAHALGKLALNECSKVNDMHAYRSNRCI